MFSVPSASQVTFCSVPQPKFCVCCRSLMSCFQTITHWLHGHQKNLNPSKYNWMHLCHQICLDFSLPGFMKLFCRCKHDVCTSIPHFSFCSCGLWSPLLLFNRPISLGIIIISLFSFFFLDAVLLIFFHMGIFSVTNQLIHRKGLPFSCNFYVIYLFIELVC